MRFLPQFILYIFWISTLEMKGITFLTILFCFALVFEFYAWDWGTWNFHLVVSILLPISDAQFLFCGMRVLDWHCKSQGTAPTHFENSTSMLVSFTVARRSIGLLRRFSRSCRPGRAQSVKHDFCTSVAQGVVAVTGLYRRCEVRKRLLGVPKTSNACEKGRAMWLDTRSK